LLAFEFGKVIVRRTFYFEHSGTVVDRESGKWSHIPCRDRGCNRR
jgi:hypothetical protein